MNADRAPGQRAVDNFYRYFAEGDPEQYRLLLASSWVNHPADSGRSPDVDGFIGGVRDLRHSLADLQIRRETTLFQDGFACCRITVSGVFIHDFAGYRATGTPAGFAAMDLHRIEDGLIAETWHFEHLEQLVEGIQGNA